MKNDDPDLWKIEELTGRRESRASIVLSIILLLIVIIGFGWIACIISQNLIAKP